MKPGAKEWRLQADVETVHNLIEIEFYEAERFTGRQDFLSAVTSYQLWFNIARKSISKDNKTPFP
ncbi:MAG: hypothetical protein Kow0090_08570 [Myxococcota bacterium]